MLMIIALVVLGLCLGSFVNALVWRVHEQQAEQEKPHPDPKYLNKLSVTKGRSICPSCKHELAARDLIPLFSWLSLRGRCRYCHKPISLQYPLVEALTAVMLVLSYIYWPEPLAGLQALAFIVWVGLLTGFMALAVYDLKWLLLPNRIIYPLSILGGLFALIQIMDTNDPLKAIVNTILSIGIGGGIFYLLFQISKGRWIGGGDVRLGWLLGLVVGTPARSLLFIFLAAVVGSLVSVPLLASKKLKAHSIIPFGPFLIIGAIIAQLFGASILEWYTQHLLNF